MARVGRIKLGSQGLEVSAQGLGCMAMSGGYGPPKPEPDMISLIHHALQSGITFLDTSDIYGPFTNELLLGKALKGMRKEVELATKFGVRFADGKGEIRGDPAYVRAACEASLKRLDVDCIDLYYQHRIDTRIPIEITIFMSSMAETPLQSDAPPPDAPQPGTLSVSHCQSQVSSLKRKNNKESDIWQHFCRPDNYDPKLQYTLHCGYCDAQVKWLSANGTSAMRNHLKICPKFPENINANSQRQKKITSVMKSSSGAENVNPIALWKFSHDVCREELAKMIVLDELPFKFVENEGFRRFCSMMQPLFKPISRVTIAKDCMGLYVAERKKLKSMFSKSKQRICLTTDAWTSNQNLSYMCLTSHWIDKDWNLHKKILNFCVISSHKGEAIGRRIEECLVDWGIQKLCTLTVDNATSNDTAITYLKRKFFKRNDSFILGGRYFQMRCCAHVLNLIVKDGLDELDGAINRIRAAVKYARSSPQRAQIFKSCVEKEGIDCKRMLCLDVTTRWNSTFLMLETAAKFEKAFDRMIDDDDKFKKELEDVCGPPTFEDWEDCRLLTTFLQKFYDATTKLSGTSYVTSHLYFSVVSSIENKLNTLMCGFDPCLKAMAVKMKLKFHKYWEPVEKMNMMLLIAIVLDPRYKLTYVSWCYEKHFKLESSTVVELTEKIMDTLNTLYVEYQQLESCNASSSSQNDELEVDQPIFNENDDLSEEYEKHMAEVENNVDKNEVKQYLDFPREKVQANSSLDILAWWKLNSSRYPILSQVARDILAIPVSTVASESAFSTGGRVLDPYRSSLSPKTVEGLICAQDWFRGSNVAIDLEDVAEEFQAFEELEFDFDEV